MEKLKVGDKVCNISHQRYGNNIYYRFDEVERLTKTQAILKNGIRLINEPTTSWNKTDKEFGEYGNMWTKWVLSTNDLIEKSKKENERQTINSWFYKQQFTQEEIVKIYNLFNPPTK